MNKVADGLGSMSMDIAGKVAIVTGAGSGIGRAVAEALAQREIQAIALIDRTEAVDAFAAQIDKTYGGTVAVTPMIGDVTDDAFRRSVFDRMTASWAVPRICVPAAGMVHDQLAAKVDGETRKAVLYPVETFRRVLEVNLTAPTYWALEMIGRIAEDRFAKKLKRWEPEEHIQGTVIFIGSVSSHGNRGQVAYAATKAGLEGVAATLTKEAMFHGVRCGVIHPGYTDTPMVRGLGEDYIRQKVLPQTQLRRLIRTEEIADAICFMISNSAVSGQLWADAGWHTPVA
jgi:NAD(P)-dependent dehydrogenase (short-subunit alcohol dehydrogenase family)